VLGVANNSHPTVTELRNDAVVGDCHIDHVWPELNGSLMMGRMNRLSIGSEPVTRCRPVGLNRSSPETGFAEISFPNRFEIFRLLDSSCLATVSERP